MSRNKHIKCAFGSNLKCQLILLFSLFLLLFMGLTTLFGTIHGSYCTILANFYFYLQYFQQKVFSFNKISGSQTDPMGVLNEKKYLHSQCLMQRYFEGTLIRD